MLTADGEAGDTPLRFFTKNTMPLWRLGLFSHNLWDTYGHGQRVFPMCCEGILHHGAEIEICRAESPRNSEPTKWVKEH